MELVEPMFSLVQAFVMMYGLSAIPVKGDSFVTLQNTISIKLVKVLVVSSFEKFASLSDGDGKNKNQLALLRQSLGPFLSVDLWVIPVPDILHQLVVTSISHIYNTLEKNTKVVERFSTVFPNLVSPVPLADPQEFIQKSISFDELCDTQSPLVPLTVIFALSMTNGNRTNKLLLQPLLEPLEWNFYGWTMLFDWAQGRREVISMEGDNGTITIISETFSTESMNLSKSSLSHASRIVFYILIYFSAVLVAIGFICTFASYRCQLESLFFFNRIAGSTWVGRPLMLLRGAAAIVLLSSPPIRLNYTSTITKIDLSTVVVHELLVPFATCGSRKAGFFGVYLSWIICMTLDNYSPIVITTQLNRKCTSVDFVKHLYCDSGMVYTGSYSRLLLLLYILSIGMPIIAIAFSYFSRQIEWKVENIAVSGSGRAFLLPPMDRLAGILSGVRPWTKHRVFDINLWCTMDFRTKKTLLSTAAQNKQWHAKPVQRTRVLFGTAYIVAAISSSFSYL
ncbi:hypothetical protein THRCLA_22577 [Thraustotheca clavata]|uniref:Transmembrane protein n=1 Tax=Thraustotheca clavata TaxID=74557 RepID=A0A1V9YX06_9STRA|nr:hypothetical protein THRCLA_22577 [Thraustotheca clavata]